MRQSAAGKAARSALSVLLVAVSALAVGAGLLGAPQPAGAGTPPTVPGAPTQVVAYPGPLDASVGWAGPSSDGGAPITQYKVRATDLTDPARGGQTAISPVCCGANVQGLTAGDRYTFRVTATNSVGTGPASVPSNAVVPTIVQRTIECLHVSGTTSGIVGLSSCHTGTGTLPGALLKGTRTGNITFTQGTQSYSTTIAITTTLIPGSNTSGYCAREGLGAEYHVHGKVTANTNPRTTVGTNVSAYLCISASGAVRQAHYGSFSF